MAVATVSMTSKRLHSQIQATQNSTGAVPIEILTQSALFLAIAAGLTMLCALAYGLFGLFAFLTW